MSPSRVDRWVVLASLYFSQGLPFGFFTLALPIVLRARGSSLEAVGAAGLLALPWALKFAWGPVVDRYGTRRAWIVPLQLLTVLLLVGLSWVDPGQDLQVLGVGMLLASVLAATQDVATDGLAVALLADEDRGIGNGLQVGAYRLGMIVGGGGVLVVYDRLGPQAAFLGMAGMLALATVPAALSREPPRHPGLGGVDLRAALGAFSAIGAAWWGVLALYKAGEAAASTMVKALLVDAGWSTSEIGALLGLGGSTAGLVGALVGGWTVGRVGRRAALLGFGLVQAVGIASFVVPSLLGATRAGTAVVVGIEHLTSGMATATLFAAMMDRCRQGHEATDYTLQACAVVFATGFASTASGWTAARLGYAGHFALAAGLSLLAVALVARAAPPKSD